MPLDRPKATESLGGLVISEPMQCHLAGTFATVSVGDLVDLNSSYTSGGLGHVLTMVMPSERLITATFCTRFIVAFAFIFFS